MVIRALMPLRKQQNKAQVSSALCDHCVCCPVRLRARARAQASTPQLEWASGNELRRTRSMRWCTRCSTHTHIAQDMHTQHALLDTYAVCLYVRMHVHGMHT